VPRDHRRARDVGDVQETWGQFNKASQFLR
jgi:hypothetical protein